MEKIAILIPCYNEEKTIEKVITDFKEVFPEATLYVYDNNSTDRTAEIAEANGAVVRKEHKQGKGNVIRRMFREIDAECYLMVDGDDTYSAKHARKMADEILINKVDMCVGDRLSSTYFKENKRLFHNFGNKLVRFLINFLFKSKIKDVMSGYRAFSYQFVKLFPVMSQGFQIETEMVIHALDKRFLLKEIEIEYRDRPIGSISKLNTYSDGFKVVKIIFVLFKEYYPLLFFSFLFLLLFTISMVMLIPVLVEYIETLLVPRFPTLIVSVFFMLAAIQSLFTGLILDVIVQKDRKNFELKRNQLK